MTFEVYDAAGAVHQVKFNPSAVEFPVVGLLTGPGDLFVWPPGVTHRQFITASGQDGLRIWLQPQTVEIDFDAFLFVETPEQAEELLRASWALRTVYPGEFGIRWLIDGGG